MRLRQIALVGQDLAAARADIEAVLGLGAPYADPGVGKYGLINAVWPVGDTFLEVVCPAQEGTTAGRLLEKRGGDGGYMAIFQTEDIEAVRRRAAHLGVRTISKADFDGVAMTHLHPKDLGGCIVSIDSMVPPERWEWGGPDWRKNVRTDVSLEITGAELQGDDPDKMSAMWAEVLDLPPESTKNGFRIQLPRGELRFVTPKDGRGEGLGCFDVLVRDIDIVLARAAERNCLDDAGNIILCGTRVRLLAP